MLSLQIYIKIAEYIGRVNDSTFNNLYKHSVFAKPLLIVKTSTTNYSNCTNFSTLPQTGRVGEGDYSSLILSP